jgi:hypothetical protein
MFWPSSNTGDRLTEAEIAALFEFTFAMAEAGVLSDGTYIGASKALYWCRLPKETNVNNAN